MGGRGARRRAEQARRLRALCLYASGMGLADVAVRLGCTPEAAERLLADTGQAEAHTTPVRCAGCGATVARVRRALPAGPCYCGPCLAARPQAPFGVRLRSLRLAAGLSRRELARRAGTGEYSVSRYETGRRPPPPAALARLVAALGEELLPPG